MCGIAGIVWPGKSPIPFVQTALEMQRHRGPDGEGQLVVCDTALVHSRLSILDLKGGQQPMESARFAVVFNGEIYNYLELKKELESKGLRFKTSSDTEVILIGFEHWGLNLFEKLRGMFAVAIADKKTGRLTLARDPFGIKPLHYFATSTGFAFSSEIRTLSTCFGSLISIDPQAVYAFLNLQFVPSPFSIFKEIKKLEAGQFLEVSAQGQIENSGFFFSLSEPNSPLRPSDLSYEEALKQTAHVIRESVQAHMLADVEVGTFLSGGIDSTLITRYASEVSPGQINSFSIGFSAKAYDESAYAQAAALKLGTRHHQWTVDGISELDVEEMVRAYGEPFGDSSAIPTYLVSKLAAQHVKVALTGDGGDELFFGYQRYGAWWQKVQRFSEHSALKKTYVKSLRRLLPNRYGPMSGEPRPNLWIKSIQLLGQQDLNEWMPGILNPSSFDMFKKMERFFDKQQHRNPMDIARWAELRYYLREDILTKVDIASMRNSLETRPPLVDPKIWDWANQLPPEYMFSVESAPFGFTGKRIIKDLLADMFPEDFIHRPKMGFGIPMHEWINEGPLTSLFLSSLHDSGSGLKDWLDLNQVKIWHETQKKSGRFDVSGQWGLLVLSVWLNQWSSSSAPSFYS